MDKGNRGRTGVQTTNDVWQFFSSLPLVRSVNAAPTHMNRRVSLNIQKSNDRTHTEMLFSHYYIVQLGYLLLLLLSTYILLMC